MHRSASYLRGREYQRGAGSGHRIKASRIDNGVEFAFTLGGLDARPVMVSMGVRRRLTSETFSRLKVS